MNRPAQKIILRLFYFIFLICGFGTINFVHAQDAENRPDVVDNVIQQIQASPDPSKENTNVSTPQHDGAVPNIVAQGDNAALPMVAEPPPTYEDRRSVMLRALDKVTARAQTFEIPVGQQFNFGALVVAVRACRARPPLEPADAAAFLQIVEQKPGEPLVPRFSGWMFSASPSLSALEHPVYDVWVLGCDDNKKPL